MINQLMTEYIKEQKASGFENEEIRKRLLESGWEITDIESGLREEVTNTERPKTRLILVIIAIITGFLGIGTWVIYRKISKPMLIINPSATVLGDKTQGHQVYKNDTYGFSIQYPVKWKSEENSASGVIVNIINPLADTDRGNRFGANINVVSESTGSLNLEDYVKLSKKVLSDTFTNYKIITENKTIVNGKNGILIEASYEMGAYQLHNYQMFMIVNSKSYVITTTSFDSAWSNYMNIMKSAIMSFILK